MKEINLTQAYKFLTMINIKQLFHELTILFKRRIDLVVLIIRSLGHRSLVHINSATMQRFVQLGTNLWPSELKLLHLLNKPSGSLNKMGRPLNRHLYIAKDWLFYKYTNLVNKSMDCVRKLTERELEILSLVSKEFSSDQIADQLILSKHTIISHRKKLLLKMGAKNTAGMIRKGFELGYLSMTKSP